jgi:hypothetical protein
MKQHRVTAAMFNPQGNNPGVPDAYVNPADLKAAGVYTPAAVEAKAAGPQLPNLGKYQTDNNIRPGSDAWFRLWFAKSNLTKERPMD